MTDTKLDSSSNLCSTILHMPMEFITLLWAELNANLFPNNIVNFTSVVNLGVNNSHRRSYRNSAFQIKAVRLS